MRWPWIKEARPIELQTAKEIPAEVFHARPGKVEEMIQMRLEERSWDEQEVRQEDGLWPLEFCLGE
jgi:hypothetical protein